MTFHPLSDVKSTKIGKNTQIWQFTIVLEGAEIGDSCNINAHCFIENDVIIGNNVTVKAGVFLWDGIQIEDNVFIGPGVTLINDKNPRSKIHPSKYIGAYIEEGASIGANSTIFGGIKIGRYSMIGAGCVLTKDTPPHTVWIGNPAIHKGYVCKCGMILNKNLHCDMCNLDYFLENDILKEVN